MNHRAFLAIILSLLLFPLSSHGALTIDDVLGNYYVQCHSGQYSYVFNAPGDESTVWRPYCFTGDEVWIVPAETENEDENSGLTVELRGLHYADDVLTGEVDLEEGVIRFPQQYIWDFYIFRAFDSESHRPVEGPVTATCQENGKIVMEGWTAEYYGYYYIKNALNVFVKDDGVTPDAPTVETRIEESAEGGRTIVCELTLPTQGTKDGEVAPLSHLTYAKLSLDGESTPMYESIDPTPGEKITVVVPSPEPGVSYRFSATVSNCRNGSEKTVDVITVGIDNIAGDTTDIAPQWYTLQGVKVEHPVPGAVYIRISGGKATKVAL